MIPERFSALCSFCGVEVDTRQPGVFQRVTGWARNRPKGTNALALQERSPIWSCSVCVDGLIKGRSPSQGSLL